MKKIMADNKTYFNVLKGIAIVLVVIGHATTGIVHDYAYSHQIALFFFISGFLYNEKKYGEDPFLNIGNRVKNNWPKYVLYTSLIGLLNFIEGYMLVFNGGQEKWDFYKYRNYFLNNIVMVNTERLCGSMWFVAALIVASSIFGIIIYCGNMANNVTNKNWTKHIVIIVLSLVCFLLGNERMIIKFQLDFRLDVALFVIPLLVLAYYISTYIKDFRKYLKIWIAIPFVLIILHMCKNKMFINSLNGQAVEWETFYLLSVLGIYQSMCFANILCMKKNFLTDLLSFFGKYTFEIMSFHFLIFKIIDVLWYKISNDTNFVELSNIPHTYEFSGIYIIFGCMIPALCKYGYDKLVDTIKEKNVNNISKKHKI